MRLLRNIFAAALLCVVMLATAQPSVRWLETQHDFGVINEVDGKVSCTMRMVNCGDSAMVITHVRTSCGCTATHYDKTPIAPGDTAQVSVTYNPANRPGNFEKNVLVFTSGEPRRSTLVIRGRVVARPESLMETYPVAFGSLRLSGVNIPLGELNRGRQRSSYITTINASATDTLLVTVDAVPSHIMAKASPDTLPPGEVGSLTVSFDTRKTPLWGLSLDTLTVLSEPIHSSETAIAGAGHVYVMAQVTEDFSGLTDKQRQDAPSVVMSDEKLMFSPNQLTARLTITNVGKQPLEVRRLWTVEKAVSIECDRTTIKRGKKATVTVALHPERLQQHVLNSQMTIVTNDPSTPSTNIRLVGEFK